MERNILHVANYPIYHFTVTVRQIPGASNHGGRSVHCIDKMNGVDHIACNYARPASYVEHASMRTAC